MADETKANQASQPVMVAMSGEQAAREGLAREYKALMETGNPNESVPGGVFEDAPGAGTFHNAHGQPVSAQGTPLSAEQARRQADAAAEEAADAAAEEADDDVPAARKTARRGR